MIVICGMFVIKAQGTGRMEKTEGRIRNATLSLLTMALFFMLLIAVLCIYLLQQHHINNEVQTRITGTRNLFREFLSTDSETLMAQIDFLKNSPAIQKAWLEKDRNQSG